LAVALAITWAVLDEYHQSFVASRTGSAGDVLIDAAGAIVGAVGYWWAAASNAAKRP
jgi:VanZ family protein